MGGILHDFRRLAQWDVLSEPSLAMAILQPSLLEEMTRRLVAEFQPEEIYLFGSHAWGNPDTDSDVDLCVVLPDSTPRTREQAARADAVLADLSVAKDVVLQSRRTFEFYRQSPVSLQHQIYHRGRRLYERGN